MKKMQQELIWACLPKETRDYIINKYLQPIISKWDDGYHAALEDIFGIYNFNPNTEPEEMLMVERKKVQEYHLRYKPLCNDDDIARGVCHAIKYFFGDKCLSDKEEHKFRFNKGDKIIVIHGKYKTITGIIKEYSKDDDTWAVILNGLSYPINFAEEWIEPYTEHETKTFSVNDKVRIKGEDKVREIYRILPDGRIMFGDKGNTYLPEDLVPYTEI